MAEKRKSYINSFRTILIYVLVITFFVGVIISYYAMLYAETRKEIIKNGELSAATSAEQIDNYLSKGIDTIKLVSYTLDNMIRTGKSQEEIHDFLVNQSGAVGSTTEENSTGIYGYINGEYVDGTEWVPDDDYVPTERPWYIEARANVGRVAVVDPYIDAETNTVMITFSKTLCDAKSVAAMDFSTDRLLSITEEIAAESDSEFEIVLDRKYNVIAHSDKSQLGKNYISEMGTFGNALVSKLRETDQNYFSLNYNGGNFMVYTVSVSNEWVCLSVHNATSIFNELKFTFLFTIIVSLLFVVILLMIMMRSNRKQEQYSRMSHVVEALAAAIDAKDKYTNGHSERVAHYAREISKYYGYSNKKQEEIYTMGLLHDIGKLGISDSVINKPGKLTDEEFDIIKAHPLIGSQMLSKTTEMPRMAIGARWHHERYDGTGYPDGLAGTKIPEEARIIAVADAYDAMTSARSYRSALPQNAVYSEIENGRGTQFDPTFANIMLHMIDEDKDYAMRDKG